MRSATEVFTQKTFARDIFKDVRGQNVPTQIFFKLATQKGNDLQLPKRQKKMGGH